MSFYESGRLWTDKISGSSGQCKTFTPKQYHSFIFQQGNVGALLFQGPNCSGNKVDIIDSRTINPTMVRSVMFWARDWNYPEKCAWSVL